MVLLTDGRTTQGVDPLLAAEQAAERRVRVYTVGFGSEDPTQLICSRAQLGSDIFRGSFGGGGAGFGGETGGARRRFLALDEPTLQAVADATGGAYQRAEDADQLARVFRELPSRVTLQEEHLEISVAFAALGALLALGAVGLSLAWNRTA